MTEKLDTIVIGAGQAGLAAGYHLARRGKPFVILDGADRVGGSWNDRWDSLRLFSPSIRDSLPGLELGGGYHFPTTGELVDYLERYVATFELPVRLGVHVDGLFREGTGFRVTAGAEAFDADHVILATGAHRVPRTPSFAHELADDIVSMHSVDYRNPGQLQPGPVLLVGAGNTGAEIAMDLAPTHEVLLAGRTVGEIPIDTRGWQGRLLFPVIWWVWEHVLTEDTKPGRKAQAEMVQGHGDPWIRQKEKDIGRAGVRRTSRIAGTVAGRPQTEDGEVLDVRTVIWCTGFEKGFGWIELPGLDSSGRLDEERGAVVGQPGLYVLGQEFQYMFNSHTVGGVGKDAAYVVQQLDRRPAAEPAVAQPEVAPAV
ncbi:MAG TPA: NAD(P)-binding domain-containing protein [Nocardioides sp.]|uniref:flavin-containing monooxygenase n=1 Tax=Nocardioides sp. TaxID=35761 RepID=UPI002E34DFA0|nr:NAD(P)-binding domain-containing protein [Nocardioides sp.]HEX5086591.1 NAD(P)-binding domain-containing protein [Nocardioides sp.]